MGIAEWFAVVLFIVGVIFLLVAVQIHGWLQPNRPELTEEQKKTNRKIYTQAYWLSIAFFILAMIFFF